MLLCDAATLATRLMDEHKLADWRFSFDRAKTRYGACRYDKRAITLSARLTPHLSEAHVRNTILHEIAHALAGPGAGHGHHWRKVALSLGCSGERCSSGEGVHLESKYVGRCPGCGREIRRHRRLRLSCVACGGAGKPNVFGWRAVPSATRPELPAEVSVGFLIDITGSTGGVIR